MHKTFGSIYGLWYGPMRAVVVSDFDMIQEIGAKTELSHRQDLGVVNGKDLI